MLKEISCDKFIEKGVTRPPIKLHSGLNSIIGTSLGGNSIGKSTFLMIIDFIFGGSSYVKKAVDVIQEVGSHTIKFEFAFSNNSYYFSRSTANIEGVNICDKEYNILNTVSKNAYCDMLKKYYGLDLPHLKFRATVSPFLRAWGRSTSNENYPLKASASSPQDQGIDMLLQIFNKYSLIEKQKKALEELKNKRRVFNEATRFDFIATVPTKAWYEKNEKRIQELENELLIISVESNKGLSDLDSMQAQQLADFRRQLSDARRQRTTLISQKKAFEAEQNPSRTKFENDFAKLHKYFPEVDLKKLTEVETFHKQLTSVLKNEFKENANNLQTMIDLANDLITRLEADISKISDIPNVSQAILDKYATAQKELILLRESNKNFEAKTKLQTEITNLESAVNELTNTLFTKIQQELNNEMARINDIIYNKTKTAPILKISTQKSYEFFTPNDRGTGSEYKGLIVFDLAMLNKTPLPVAAHDSVLLKQIEADGVDGIFEIYAQQTKQVFIVLDRIDTYLPKTQETINSSVVLKLYPNGGELFGRAWNTEREVNKVEHQL